MELTEKKDGSERVLHWLNYKLGAPVRSTPVSVAVPKGKKAIGVKLISPDRAGAHSLEFAVEGERVRFTLPPLEVYSVAVVQLSN